MDWEASDLMHRWVFHRAIWTCGFAMCYLCYIEGATGNDSDTMTKSWPTQYQVREGSATLRIHRDTGNTIGMFGNRSVKLPMPTQLDGRSPEFRDFYWSGDVKVYLTIHNVHIEGYMGESAKSVETIDIRNTQDAYAEEDTQLRDNRSPTVPTEDEADELEDYIELTVSIRKRDEIRSISQSLNYALAHATKPGSEPHSMIRRRMRTANGFDVWRQLNLRTLVVTELNNFHYCIQSCLHSGMQTNTFLSNTTGGSRTSIATVGERSHCGSENRNIHQSLEGTHQSALDVEGHQLCDQHDNH
eukprot:6492043-Amphidinium_carterae.1